MAPIRNHDSPSSSSRPGPSTQNGNGDAESREELRRRAREKVFERQSEEEKQRLRRDYHELQNKADDMKGNLENIKAKELRQQLRNSDNLLRNVKDTGMASIDARLFITTTDTAANLVRKMKIGGGALDLDEILNRIKVELAKGGVEEEDDEEEDEIDDDEGSQRRRRAGRRAVGDWESIGWQAAALTRRVHGVEFMYGPLSVQHQKRTVARREKAARLAPEVRPDTIVPTGGKEKADETTTNVMQVMKVLKRLDPTRQGYNFFKLVVNPKDFGQTVENMFYTSFLVKDGRAGIRVEDDGEVVIREYDPDNADLQGDLPRNQVVLELDEETWKTAVEVFGIQESAIPHRQRKVQDVSGGRWYT